MHQGSDYYCSNQITKNAKVAFTFADKIMNAEMVMAPRQLDENHAKVTSVMSMFEEVKEKLNGKPKISEIDLKLPFGVEKEPLSIEINCYLKNQELSNQGVLINHVIYILTIDFIARKQFKIKNGDWRRWPFWT